MSTQPVPEKEPSSATQAIDLRLNGNRHTIPLQGGMFGVITAFVVKAWLTFNQMQTDVTTALDSLESLTASVQSMRDNLAMAVTTSNQHSKDINRLDGEIAALDKRSGACEDALDQLCEATGSCKQSRRR